MKFLCIDTATQMESVALVENETVLAEKRVERVNGHGGGILDDIHELLESSGWRLGDIEALGIGLGPGSFTGLRIGLATAKGLALALKRPIFGVRTTALLLAAVPKPALAVVDARRGQVYIEGASLERPVCCAPERLSEHIDVVQPTLLVGDGALRYGDILTTQGTPLAMAEEAAHHPQAGLIPSQCRDEKPADLATLNRSMFDHRMQKLIIRMDFPMPSSGRLENHEGARSQSPW